MTYPSVLPALIFDDRYVIQSQDEPSENSSDYVVIDTLNNELCTVQKFVAASKTQAVVYRQHLEKLLSLSQLQVEQTRDCFVSDRAIFVVKKPVIGQFYSEVAVEQGRFAEPDVIWLLEQVLAVLSKLHQNGIRHCNLSPDTICLRTADGKPILTQFGFFRDDVIDVRLNRSPSLQSQAFRLIGVAISRDDREDLHSLALTAMMLLTGQPLSTLFNSHSRRWDWETFCPVSQDFRQVLNRMLSVDASDWFASADEFLFALSLAREETSGSQVRISLPAQSQPVLWSEKDGIDIFEMQMAAKQHCSFDPVSLISLTVHAEP